MRILIAEDETIIRLDLRTMLVRHGFDVCGEARDGVEAVDLARELAPDLAIFDIKMPRLDGIEAARRIVAERPMPIVMLTAFSDARLVNQAIDAGAFAYLVKPFREEDLLPAIRTAAARHADLVIASALKATEPRPAARPEPVEVQAPTEDEMATSEANEAELFRVLQEVHAEALANAEQARAVDGDTRDKIREFVTRHVRFKAERLAELGVYQHVRLLRDDHRRTIVEARNAYDQAFTALLVEGQRDGLVRASIDPRLATVAVLGMLNWNTQPGRDSTPAELASAYADYVLAGLTGEAAGYRTMAG